MKMGDYYEIELFFDGSITLKRLAELMDILGSSGIMLDFMTMEIEDEGIYMEAEYNTNDYPAFPEIEALIESLDGVELDYETMAEWM